MHHKVLWLLLACLVSTAASAQHKSTVTLNAVGDVLLDRGVRRDIQRFGMSYPFSATSKVLSASDLTFANLECPLAARAAKVGKKVTFKASPTTAHCLSRAGIDIVSLANNHALDCGPVGLRETFRALKRHKVLWCGAGSTGDAAELATRVTIKGVRVAFVAFSEFRPTGFASSEAKSAIALASPTTIQRAVNAARVGADVVVASFHWGIGGQSRPTVQQKAWAHLAVRCGADLVLGHHPHVLQGIGTVAQQSTLKGRKRRALIAYSLGNFVFDAPRRYDRRTAQTLILRVTLDRLGVRSAEVVPVVLEGTRPRPATGAQAVEIVRRLTELSGELGTQISNGRVIAAR